MLFRKKDKQQTVTNSKDPNEGLTQGVLMAHCILLGHVALLGGIAVLMFMFGGIVQNFWWILLAGAATIAGSAWYFFKKIKQEHQALRQLLQLPELRGRSLEISFLGGAASLRLGHTVDTEAEMKRVGPTSRPLLEDAASARIKDLGELGRLYEQKMITAEEYEVLKKEILASVADFTGGDSDGDHSSDQGDDAIDVIDVTGVTRSYKRG